MKRGIPAVTGFPAIKKGSATNDRCHPQLSSDVLLARGRQRVLKYVIITDSPLNDHQQDIKLRSKSGNRMSMPAIMAGQGS